MTGSVQSGLLYPLDQIAFDNSQAGVNQVTYPTMLFGQTLLAQPFGLVPISSVAAARATFGRGSHLSRMFEAYFANDTTGPIYCLPFADASGSVAATGLISPVGVATAPGTLTAYIGGQVVQAGVNIGDTASIMSASLVAAITALPDLAVTAVAFGTGGAQTKMTAKNAGLLGNLIDLRMNYYGAAGGEQLPAGVTVAVTAMSGGATDPDTTTVAAVLGDTPMRFIVQPYTSSAAMAAMATMMSFSGGRWAPTRKAWGHVWTARAGLLAAHVAFNATTNDPHSLVFEYELGSPTPVWEAAAAYCGTAAASLRTQPNLPLQTLAMNAFLPPPLGLAEASGGAFGKTSWQTLLGTGGALARYGGGNVPQILRAPTTYQTNSFGQPDQSYFDTEDMYTLMKIADMIEGMETQKFSRSLIADDGTAFGPGLPIVTPKSALAEFASLYTEMQRLGLVEDSAAMLAATIAQRNASAPSELDILFAPFIVVGLRQIGNTIQFRKYSAAAAAALVG